MEMSMPSTLIPPWIKTSVRAFWGYVKNRSVRPIHAVAYAAMGMALRNEGRHEEAVLALRKAKEGAGDRANICVALGDTLAVLGRFSEAKSEYEDALSFAPGNPDALRGKGRALREMGNAEAALACFNDALESQPKRVEILAGLYETLIRLVGKEQVQAALDRSLRNDVQTPAAPLAQTQFL